MRQVLQSQFPDTAALTRHCVLTSKGELGFIDREGQIAIDPIATDAFRTYSQKLIAEYLQHPNEGGMHLGIIVHNDGKRPWKSMTIRFSDSLLRRLYSIRDQKSTDPLTTFQKRNQWQSIYRGLELLLEYRVESMPGTPIFCPVILDRKIDAAIREALLASAADEIDESIPLLEIINFASLMTPVEKDEFAVNELIQKISAGVIYKSLRKPSKLSLIDDEIEEPVRLTAGRAAPATTSPTLVGIRLARSHSYQRIPLDRLRQYETFSRLADLPLSLLAEGMAIIGLHSGEKLLERGTSDQFTYFLLDGTAELKAADRRVQIIHADEAPARRPLSHLRPRQFTIRALDDAKFLRVDHDQVTALQGSVEEGAGTELPSPWIFESLYQDLIQQRTVLTGIPALTRRVLHLMERNANDIESLAELAALDPVVAVKLLRAANRSDAAAEQPALVPTLKEAIEGLQVDFALSLIRQTVEEELCELRNPLVRKRLERLWRHSMEVACISHVLAQRNSDMDPERARAHGLIHDIGTYAILNYADQATNKALDRNALEQQLTSLHGWVGAVILKEWKLPEEFVTTNLEGDNWYRDNRGAADYCDVVILAQLHHFVGTPMTKVTPTIDMVPASAKLFTGNLTPSLSLELLRRGRRMANDAARRLTA